MKGVVSDSQTLQLVAQDELARLATPVINIQI